MVDKGGGESKRRGKEKGSGRKIDKASERRDLDLDLDLFIGPWG